MVLFEMLAFDTAIFGVKVAKILPEKLTQDTLSKTLQQLREEKVKLVYWCTDPKDIATQAAARLHHGFLADEKTTYFADLEKQGGVLNAQVFEFYTENTANAELLALAYESGKFSRFLKDQRIGLDKFKHLYKCWINNSCNHSVAEGVILIQEKNIIVGMVTVGQKNQRGDIGLLAVSPSHLRKGYGSQLVRMAQAYFFKKGIFHVQVVTQKDNHPACRLYEKNYFHVESIQNFYHFWL